MNVRLLPRLVLALAVLLPTPLLAQLRFEQGRHYHPIAQPQTTGLAPAGRIEVAEVFSYICSACANAHALVDALAQQLPADAAMVYVHAGFNRGWPAFQRAHITAQKLGIADRNHTRLFTAIWETAEFPFFDRATGRPRQEEPTVRDFARFYAQGGTTEDAFVKKSASAEVEEAVKRSEALVKAWQVPGTPTFVVAGRYRINNELVSSLDDLKALVDFLVGQERKRLQAGAAKK